MAASEFKSLGVLICCYEPRKLQIYGLRGDELNQENAKAIGCRHCGGGDSIGWLFRLESRRPNLARSHEYPSTNHKFSPLFNERPAEDRDPMRSSSRCRQNTRRLAKTRKRTSALLSGISNFSRSSSLHFIACQRLFHIRLGNSELSSNP